MMKGLFTLTSSESKRLIAKAVPLLPQVNHALENGTIIVANGTTNAFVAEELGGARIPSKLLYSAGIITQGMLGTTPVDKRIPALVLQKGKRVDIPWQDALAGFGPGDVFIKGGNAIDLDGCVGVLVADPNGGTIGRALPVIQARGATLVMPVGLEKLVPSVAEAAGCLGARTFDWALGTPVGMIVVTNAEIITEIEAIELLTGASATCVASGGIGGSEGAVTLVVTGDERQVGKAREIVEAIKGEGPITW